MPAVQQVRADMGAFQLLDMIIQIVAVLNMGADSILDRHELIAAEIRKLVYFERKEYKDRDRHRWG